MKNDKINLINIENLKNRKFTFIEPNHSINYENALRFQEFERLSRDRWFDRAVKGQKISIEKIGNVENIINLKKNIDSYFDWEILKAEQELLYGELLCPTILKNEKGFYVVADELNLIILNHLKKDIEIWLIDETLNTEDFLIKKDNQIEKIYPNYDYGKITDKDVILVREIISILEKEKSFSTAEQLKIQFQLKENEKYDIQKSLFFKYCEKAGIRTSKQGFITVSENGKITEYPIVSVGDDIRRLNKIIEEVYKDVESQLKLKK